MSQHGPVNLTCLHILFVKEQTKYKWFLQNMQLVSPPMPHCIVLVLLLWIVYFSIPFILREILSFPGNHRGPELQ